MNEVPNQKSVPSSQSCVNCSRPLVDGGDFCPFCGTKALSSSTVSTIDSYILNKVNLELSNRLKDQTTLVREIGDKAEDIVWSRLKRYGVIIGALIAVIIGTFTLFGMQTLGDASKRIEPIVSAAVQRAQAAKYAIDQAAANIDLMKSSIDQLSRDVEAQIKRVSESGSVISQKLKDLDVAADDARKRGEAYRARSEDLAGRLEAMEKALESKVEQISKQIDNVSIRQVYPTLGQPKFVTFQNSRWKGSAEKGPTEKWVDIYIDPFATADISPDKLEGLMGELKNSGYTPLLGSFGIGGPYSSGYGSIGDSPDTTVFYFRAESKPMALEVSAIVSRKLSTTPVEPRLEDLSRFGGDDKENRQFIIEKSGLDLQLFIRHPAR